MTSVPIPEALAFYLANAVNNNAINTIVSVRQLPPKLTLPDLRGAANARLTAAAVKAALEVFLLDVWLKTWGDALLVVNVSVADVMAHDPESNWEFSRVTGTVRFGREKYILAVWLNRDMDDRDFGALQLGFWDENEPEDIEFIAWAKLYSGSRGWESDEDDEVMTTPPDTRMPEMASSTIEIASLCAAAGVAVEAIRTVTTLQ